MHAPLDPFDPNTWAVLCERDYRLYAGCYADHACLVDEEDYHHFGQWLWQPKVSLCGKVYFKRTYSVYDDERKRSGAVTLYLHSEILRRAQGEPPTKRRSIADHWNGDSNDNRRQNLRWVTKRENGRNRFGRDYYQRALL